MLRSRQEKEQLVRKFEEIAPFLKNINKFGWIEPECYSDPLYQLYPDASTVPSAFKPFTVNAKTGWHSEYIYRDSRGIHRVREGTVEIKDEWSDYCYRACCSSPAHIRG